jgi:hypothetical protein
MYLYVILHSGHPSLPVLLVYSEYFVFCVNTPYPVRYMYDTYMYTYMTEGKLRVPLYSEAASTRYRWSVITKNRQLAGTFDVFVCGDTFIFIKNNPNKCQRSQTTLPLRYVHRLHRIWGWGRLLSSLTLKILCPVLFKHVSDQQSRKKVAPYRRTKVDDKQLHNSKLFVQEAVFIRFQHL